MRWKNLIAVCLWAGVCKWALGTTLPITAKEISLMLRSGYSSEAVLREVQARKFADTFDSATEQQLTRAGAKPDLIEALRAGAYQLSESEIAAFREKVAANRERVAEEQSNEAAQKTDEKSAPSRAAAPTRSNDSVYRLVKGDLIYWHQGVLVPFDDAALEKKKLYLFFFSALASREGRQFTPQLVDYYNRIAPQHPEFEVIFFSADRSQYGMETYIAQTNMPWPAIAYDKLAGKVDHMEKNLVREIPCLLLADASGNILSTSHGDGGLQKVISDLDQILTRGDSALARKQ